MKEKLYLAIGAVVVGMGLEALYFHKKIKAIKDLVDQAQDSVDKAADILSNNIEVDVPDGFIEKAINKAVDKEVGHEIKVATIDIVSDVKTEMKKKISNNVDQAFNDTKTMVQTELKRQVDGLSIESIKKEVLIEAKKEAADRFKHDLDDILEKHNQELDKVTEIYSSIAKKMRGDD